ncbi:MAG: hypothetical protein GXY48_01595 [Methanomicrobiales archaeon]|nr:hypothetical protein [Methanomicrobiales archaeon]
MDIIRNIAFHGGTSSDRSEKPEDDLPILFLALIPIVIIVPVLPIGFSSRIVIVFFLTLLFIAGIYSMRKNRRRFLMSCILALVATEAFWVSTFPAASSLFLLAEFFLLIFLVYLAGYLFKGLLFSKGTLVDILGLITALIFTGGIMLGTGLHLSSWLSRATMYDPLLIHTSFATAIPEGIILLLMGSAGSFGNMPLVMVIRMTGAIAGFVLLVVSAGKVAGYYVKYCLGKEEKE